PAYAAAGPAEDLARLLADAWAWELRENPVRASRLGERRYDDRWRDMSLAAIERREREQRAFMERLRAIDPEALGDEDRLNYELFRRQLQNDIDAYRFRTYLMPVSHRGGVQNLESVAEALPFTRLEHYEDWLARMAAVDTVLSQARALMARGRRSGYGPPEGLRYRVPEQLAAQPVEAPGQSPCYAVFERIPAAIGEAEADRLRNEALALIEAEIVPAYREFDRWFRETYLPACRESI